MTGNIFFSNLSSWSWWNPAGCWWDSAGCCWVAAGSSWVAAGSWQLCLVSSVNALVHSLKRDLLQSLTNHHNPFHHVYIKRIPSDVRRDVLYMAVLENIKRPIRGRNGWIILDIISDIRGLALSLFQLKKCVLMQRGKTERKITIRALAILYIKIFLMAVPT